MNIISGRRLLIKSLPSSINLMLKVAELAKKQGSLSSFIVSQGLNLFQLGTQGRLDLEEHIHVVVNISNYTKEISILSSNLPLGGLEISKSKVSLTNFLVKVIECVKEGLVGLVRRCLCSHNFISSRSSIIDFIDDMRLVFVNFGLHQSAQSSLEWHLGVSSSGFQEWTLVEYWSPQYPCEVFQPQQDALQAAQFLWPDLISVSQP